MRPVFLVPYMVVCCAAREGSLHRTLSTREQGPRQALCGVVKVAVEVEHLDTVGWVGVEAMTVPSGHWNAWWPQHQGIAIHAGYCSSASCGSIDH